MLEISDVIDLCKEGIDINLKLNCPDNPTRKGLWIPEYELIEIYFNNIVSREDLYLTLIHEFLHAKGETYNKDQGKEEDIMKMEKIVYKKNPEIPYFIIDLYDLNIPKRLR